MFVFHRSQLSVGVSKVATHALLTSEGSSGFKLRGLASVLGYKIEEYCLFQEFHILEEVPKYTFAKYFREFHLKERNGRVGALENSTNAEVL